ncbi:hypothetical protein 12Stean4476_00012 [Erwinia phage Stean]|nr:hypothetical protein 12Stean4476_00012 [Erwinia phage Stean]
MSNQKFQTKAGCGRKKTSIGIARDEALAAGLKFFNGKCCEKDPSHGTIRRTENNSCYACTKESNNQRSGARKSEKTHRITTKRVNMSDPGFCWPVRIIGNPDRVRNEP